MKRALTTGILLATFAISSSADICYFGYSDAMTNFSRQGSTIIFDDWFSQQGNAGINAQAGMISFTSDYTLLRDAFPEVIAGLDHTSAKMYLDMSHLLFKAHDTGVAVDCREYEGSRTDVSFPGQPKFNLHPNFRLRLDDFITTQGHLITHKNTYGVVLHAEANNSCIPNSELTFAAAEVKKVLPGFPVVVAYGFRQNTVFGEASIEKGLPDLFPSNVDIIGFWSYSTYDPLTPSAPKNTTAISFFDPLDPNSTNTLWGYFKARLRGPHNGGIHQRVVHVPEAFYGPNQQASGWSQNDLTAVARNWAHWDSSQPLNQGNIAFLWETQSPDLIGSMDLAVRNEHGIIANSTTDCPPMFQTNALQNGDFELDIKIPPFEKAIVGTLDLDDTVSYSGAHSLRHISSSNDSFTTPYRGANAAVAPVAPGQVFKISTWAKASAQARIQLFIFCLDQNYEYLQFGFENSTFEATADWQKFTLDHACPLGTKYISARLDNDESGKTVWWDDIRIVGSQKINNLQDGGFESGSFFSPFKTAHNGTLSIDEDEAINGASSLKHVATGIDSRTGPWKGPASAVTPVYAEQTFTLSAWAKSSTSAEIELLIICLDSDYDYTRFGAVKSRFTATSAWQPYSLEHTCPIGTQYASIRLDNNEAGKTVWWDDVEFRSNSILPYGGFESGFLQYPFLEAHSGTLTLDSTQAHTGNASLKHTASQDNSPTRPWRGAEAPIGIVFGEQAFKLSAWAKASATTEIDLLILCLDSTFNHRQFGGKRATFSSSTNWQEYELTHTCPIGTEFVSIRLDNNEGGKTVWWDDIRLIEE